MNLEKELDNWRKECLETMFYALHYRSMCAFKESADTYKLAIDQHALEYLNNRSMDIQKYYQRLK